MNPPSPGNAPAVAAVVMAAGLGTRMKSRTPKLLHPLAGRPMIAYVVDAGREATSRRPLVVTSPATAAVRDALGDAVDYALQPEPPPARSTIGVGGLPKGALVEIEAIAHRPIADAVANRGG
ncbi:MAG TPA: NTP transferase domain-containing protein [Candidatus Limnocylindrales bacterium]|nr:NTP transferase domain-containing protein [Candidatus Limnocylindrales bacterium]